MNDSPTAGRDTDALVAEAMGLTLARPAHDWATTCGRAPESAVGVAAVLECRHCGRLTFALCKDDPGGEPCVLTAEPYSTDIAAAWRAVDWLRPRSAFIVLDVDGDGFACEVALDWDARLARGSADSAPLAVCRALLAAKQRGWLDG